MGKNRNMIRNGKSYGKLIFGALKIGFVLFSEPFGFLTAKGSDDEAETKEREQKGAEGKRLVLGLHESEGNENFCVKGGDRIEKGGGNKLTLRNSTLVTNQVKVVKDVAP